MYTTAIYPGTFDPFTYGHEDVVGRAARVFKHVIVAIAANPKKMPLFDWSDRIALAQEILQPYGNVTVQGFDGLLINFARQQRAHMIVRGLRAASDFEYEFQLAGMNRQIAPEIETLFFTPGERYVCVSSSLVREIAELGGDVSPFVAPPVVLALQKRCVERA